MKQTIRLDAEPNFFCGFDFETQTTRLDVSWEAFVRYDNVPLLAKYGVAACFERAGRVEIEEVRYYG